MNDRYSAGLWIFTGCSDRYTSLYSPAKDTDAQIAAAGSVKGLKGIEAIYPWHLEGYSVQEFKRAVTDVGLEITSVNPNIWASQFKHGAFSNPDRVVRQQAVDLCKRTADIARELGCHASLLWPGQDGVDYPFQVNHADLWEWTVEGYRQVAEYASDVAFSVEYKLREPRVRSIASDAATTLLLCQGTGRSNIGAALDLGHSLQAKESPAGSVAMLAKYDRLFAVHLNDNTRAWDDDLTTGSLHLAETVEFLHALAQVDYRGWLTIDITPFREDAVKACQLNLDVVTDLQELVSRMDWDAMATAQVTHDAISAHRIFFQALMPKGVTGPSR